MKKLTLLLLLTIFTLTACNTNLNTENTSEVTKNKTNISDKTINDLVEYSNKDLGIQFKYPNDLLINTSLLNNKKGVVLYNNDYKGNEEFGWGKINSGFKIMIRKRTVGANWWNDYGKENYGAIESESFGTPIKKEIIKIGDYEAAKITEEGRGLYNKWPEAHILTTIVIPNNDYIIEMSFMTKKSDYDKYVDIFDQVVQSFKFVNKTI